MQLLEKLKRIGLPGETINTYIEKGLIESNGLGEWFIVSGDLLITLITKCVACKIKPDFLLLPEPNDYKDELDVLYKNLINHNYMMACEAAELIKKDIHTQQLELFINTCKNYKDNNHYILCITDYGKDKATREGLQKLERKLLLYLELFDLEEAANIANLICTIYKGYSVEFPYNINNLYRILKEMSSNHLQVGNSSDELYIGPSTDVLNQLLDDDDIYRADDLITDELARDPYSVEWQIYFALMYQIKAVNEKNMKVAIERTVVDAGLDEDNAWAFPETTFPRMSKEDVLRIKNGREYEIDDLDYYTEYENALFEDCDYDYAKECLEKYQKQSMLSYDDSVYDYLFDEIEILKKNEELGINMIEFNTSLQFVMNYMELEKYDLALNYAAKCYNMLQVQDPRLQCMLGKIYYKKGDLKKSSYFYSEAFKKAVSPDDLADMIEVFFMNKEYKKVISATCRYDYYDEMQNAKVHYICASAFLKLRKYDDSRAELETASTILSADENLPIDFAEEREIIDEAEQGKYKTFGIEDYIDYELTDEEYMIAQYLDENVEQANKVFETIKTNKDNYTENLKYLLSVTKALFQSYDFDRALDLCSKIDEIFDTEFLSEKDAKVMRKMINNLKRI